MSARSTMQMRLGEMLVKAGVTSELNVNAALAEQRQWGGKLGQILVRMGAVPEHMLVLALSRQLHIPHVDLTTIEVLPSALVERLPRQLCEQYRVLPLAWIADRKAVQLAMADPLDVVAADDLQRLFGTRIEMLLAGEQALAEATRRLFGAQSSSVLWEQSSGPVLMDNGGRVRADETGRPRAATQPPTPIAVTPPPAQAAPSQPPVAVQPPAGNLAAEVASHVDKVRVVAELLAMKGVVRPGDLPGR